jgi:hypothetical protein
MDFQYIFSQLEKVEIFCENIYSVQTITYFLGTVMYAQYVFFYADQAQINSTVNNHLLLTLKNRNTIKQMKSAVDEI